MAIAMHEIQRRIDKAIANYKCELMNNTKWREVLDLIGKHAMPVQFSFVRDEQFKSLTRFPEGGTEGDHTKDCTVHGPFFLREIYAIRCPRYEEKRDPESGRKYNDQNRYIEFVESLQGLGQLPISEEKTGIVIYGYQK